MYVIYKEEMGKNVTSVCSAKEKLGIVSERGAQSGKEDYL